MLTRSTSTVRLFLTTKADGGNIIGKKFRCAVVNGEKRHVKLTEKIW